jgi:hypothetical protein
MLPVPNALDRRTPMIMLGATAERGRMGPALLFAFVSYARTAPGLCRTPKHPAHRSPAHAWICLPVTAAADPFVNRSGPQLYTILSPAGPGTVLDGAISWVLSISPEAVQVRRIRGLVREEMVLTRPHSPHVIWCRCTRILHLARQTQRLWKCGARIQTSEHDLRRSRHGLPVVWMGRSDFVCAKPMLKFFRNSSASMAHLASPQISEQLKQ